MASGINKVIVGGNLGQDPEIRVTQGGMSVMTMSVGCNESYLDRNRQRQERVEWVRCVVWGKRAEGLARFLRRGSWVMVEGSLKMSSWEDRDGIKRYKTEVVAHQVYLGGAPTSRGNSARSRNQGPDPQRHRPNRRDEDNDQHDYGGGDDGGGAYDDNDYGGGGDDDIPFARITRGSREPWWRF